MLWAWPCCVRWFSTTRRRDRPSSTLFSTVCGDPMWPRRNWAPTSASSRRGPGSGAPWTLSGATLTLCLVSGATAAPESCVWKLRGRWSWFRSTCTISRWKRPTALCWTWWRTQRWTLSCDVHRNAVTGVRGTDRNTENSKIKEQQSKEQQEQGKQSKE